MSEGQKQGRDLTDWVWNCILGIIVVRISKLDMHRSWKVLARDPFVDSLLLSVTNLRELPVLVQRGYGGLHPWIDTDRHRASGDS